MIIVISIIVFLLILLGISCFYMLRFAKMVLSIENNLSNTLKAFDELDKFFISFNNKKLYFEAPELSNIIMELRKQAFVCKLEVQKTIDTFTAFSEKKYIVEVAEE